MRRVRSDGVTLPALSDISSSPLSGSCVSEANCRCSGRDSVIGEIDQKQSTLRSHQETCNTNQFGSAESVRFEKLPCKVVWATMSSSGLLASPTLTNSNLRKNGGVAVRGNRGNGRDSPATSFSWEGVHFTIANLPATQWVTRQPLPCGLRRGQSPRGFTTEWRECEDALREVSTNAAAARRACRSRSPQAESNRTTIRQHTRQQEGGPSKSRDLCVHAGMVA